MAAVVATLKSEKTLERMDDMSRGSWAVMVVATGRSGKESAFDKIDESLVKGSCVIVAVKP